jgi:hypothetical protein
MSQSQIVTYGNGDLVLRSQVPLIGPGIFEPNEMLVFGKIEGRFCIPKQGFEIHCQGTNLPQPELLAEASRLDVVLGGVAAFLKNQDTVVEVHGKRGLREVGRSYGTAAVVCVELIN